MPLNILSGTVQSLTTKTGFISILVIIINLVNSSKPAAEVHHIQKAWDGMVAANQRSIILYKASKRDRQNQTSRSVNSPCWRLASRTTNNCSWVEDLRWSCQGCSGLPVGLQSLWTTHVHMRKDGECTWAAWTIPSQKCNVTATWMTSYGEQSSVRCDNTRHICRVSYWQHIHQARCSSPEGSTKQEWQVNQVKQHPHLLPVCHWNSCYMAWHGRRIDARDW